MADKKAIEGPGRLHISAVSLYQKTGKGPVLTYTVKKGGILSSLHRSQA
ncbi:hypothetical protein BACAU_0397 [Bacillus velezensis CAU B946]|nr:hypothetical protein BACAU_0397 [Bacillus velezensis CAU B946]